MDAAGITTRSVRDVRLPSLGLGAAPLGNLFRAIGDEAAAAAIDTAWSAGIRYFDTAPHYGLGLSERRLGRALAGRPREDYVLSTKVGRLLRPQEAGGRMDDEGYVVPADFRRVRDYSRDGIRRSIEESLTRLGLDRIDIAYLHDPDEFWGPASTTGIDALVELREEGVLRAVGAGMNQAEMLVRFVREADVDLVMVAGRYTLLDQRAADELLPAALERGVGVVAAGAYNSGVLSEDRPRADAQFDYADAPAEVLERASRIADVCESFGVRLPVAATQFAQRHPAVVSTVLGLRTADEVRSAIERLAARVPSALWTELERQHLIHPDPNLRGTDR